MMRILSSTLFLIAACWPCISLAAQSPASPPPATPQTSEVPSVILQPALDTLRQTLETLRPDKWKTSSAVRDETSANISSIRRDLDTTLPALLATADKAPNSVTQTLPAFRNIEALYDVLLRVSEVGAIFAPGQQGMALEQARASLEDARHTLGDRLQSAAVSQDQQLRQVQAALHSIQTAPAPA